MYWTGGRGGLNGDCPVCEVQGFKRYINLTYSSAI